MSTDPQKSWQARIGEATDAIAQSFVESISYDKRLYKHDIAGSIAHAAMLAKVGLITEDERAQIEAGLRSIEQDLAADRLPLDVAMEDIHMVVEAELIKRVGEPGRKLHTGRSRNDQVALDFTMWIASATAEVGDRLHDLLRAFCRLAERSREIVMPSYTHLQRAQPILAGAEAIAWATMFSRDFGRLFAAIPPVFGFHPLGSGAIAGTSLPLDRRETYAHRSKHDIKSSMFAAMIDATIEQLGITGIPDDSSIENTATRDHACRFVFDLAMIAQHLSRWAEQWIIYMTTEFGFIKIADRYTTSSSMMPQKRNPDMLELIRGRCGNVYGDLFALMTILKGLPIGYNRDLQEDKRIVDSASYDKERIEPTLDRGFLDATSLAEYLVTKGVPFRTAHHVVGTLVARCEREGKHALSQLPVESFNEVIATKSDVRVADDVYTCLGARNVVARYRSAGAAGGKPFEDQLAAWKQKLRI